MATVNIFLNNNPQEKKLRCGKDSEAAVQPIT
jgi:hypothetical protein